MSDSVTPWTTACQASLSITNFWSPLKLMSVELVMPSNHLILCHPLLLLPSVFPNRVFFSESALCINWPKYWSFSFSITFQRTPRTDLLQNGLVGSPCSPRDSQESSPTKVHLVKAMVFPVVMYGCKSWTVKKAEHCFYLFPIYFP